MYIQNIMEKEESKQDWYCPKCQSYVSSENVTFEEMHQICNTGVVIKKEHKQETLEEDDEIQRSDLYNKIHSIVKQIPRENVDTDAMDYPSCAYELEQLFYKWQQERSYSEEEVWKLVNKLNETLNIGSELTLEQWFEQFKKK